ncbi:hypothetical protein GBA52_023809 [Prunus armeniaca]|nr:hypothetical protein GBA52_023809 [Prunus armeniaca]
MSSTGPPPSTPFATTIPHSNGWPARSQSLTASSNWVLSSASWSPTLVPCSDGIFSCPRTEPIFQFAINAYCRVGRLVDAVNAFDSMRKLIDGRPSVVVYNILIHGFVKCGQHDKALGLYDKMMKDRVKADVFTFNILISSLLSERKFEDGIGMAYEMIEFGCKFSSVTCEILGDGLCREGRVSEACSVRKEIQGRALEVVDELWRKGNVPSLIACTTLIEGLRRSARIDEAFGLMKRMLEEGIVPDIVTFNCLLQDLCNLRRTVEADSLKLLSSSKGLDLDSTAYSILVSGYSREGKRKEQKLLVDEMLDKGFIPDLGTYNRLAD